ncbi:MAG: hypothetical protein JNK74_10695 [Candidatus Hydrogenedentes bacterium]|nr:hypothetical protein [Candidatus Hydrogenedentota bacterium]
MPAYFAFVLALAIVLSAYAEPSIRLYNPTEFTGPALVEIPTGRIASPGMIDWSNHHLEVKGEVLPQALREGRAHWKSTLAAPLATPRAEDLLVFWCAVPPGEWVEVAIVSGALNSSAAMEIADGKIAVRYPGVEANIDASTGLLTGLSVGGESMLDAPMTITASTLAPDPFQYTGNIGPGYIPFQVAVKSADPVSITAHLASQSSTPAMTELNFVLQAASGPDLALTYRIHNGGLVEIVADERPWTGPSPWMNHAVQFTLPLKGDAQSLPLLENRHPFYGFKDFPGTLPQIAQRIAGETVDVVVLGDEIVNGRHWQRRIQGVSRDGENALDALVEIMDEGLVVVPMPLESAVPVWIVDAPDKANAVAARLSKALGAPTQAELDAAQQPDVHRITLDMDPSHGLGGVEGDGYAITIASDGGIRISAHTLLGLNKAVSDVIAHLGDDKRIPLIARNPVVEVRGGGFGGGAFEVDFSYGDDAEWERVFDGLLDSGMNTFWCLGMWGNWKMPVSYKYMPELHSDDPEAYDESSGVLFRELDQHREHGLKLMRYLQERGGRVYVWLPIGCVPTTFVKQYPEALKPGTVEEFWGRPKGTPCFTHPKYAEYLDAFLKELVETYPLDGVVLVRDDNGGICDCERCTAFTAASTTKVAVWEQYLQIHGRLRGLGFNGAVGVYPYFDGYTPALDAQMPEDLFIAGHGASTAALTRDQSRIGHMPDTWLDNLYTNFKLPPSPRMRRLLGDRGSFYIGGAYQTTELPWEAMGYFGWEPTATANSFRYQWGARNFGKEAAVAFVRMNDVYEDLWEINARYLIPNVWIALDAESRSRVAEDIRALLRDYDARLGGMRTAVSPGYEEWLNLSALFTPFLEYQLRRLELFTEMIAIAKQHGPAIDSGTLPEEVRAAMLAKYAEMKDYATKYATVQGKLPGNMMEATRSLTMPYNEWMTGFEGWLDPHLGRPQFAAKVVADPIKTYAGEAFTINVEIQNTGVIPWDRCDLTLSENATALGWKIDAVTDEQPIAPGDRVTRTITGTVPSEAISATVSVFSPTRNRTKMAEVPLQAVLVGTDAPK